MYRKGRRSGSSKMLSRPADYNRCGLRGIASMLAKTFSAILMLAVSGVFAQQPAPKPTTAAEAPTGDTSYIDEKGTAHITRVVPVPDDLSPEAKKSLSRAEPDQAPPEPLEERRKRTDAYAARAKEEWLKICPVDIKDQEIEGVPTRVVTPQNMPMSSHNRILLNLHGGGFNSDSGSYTESIPMAYYTKVKVVAVLYRLAPEHPFPAAVDDSIAVYKALLKVYSPEHIAIYGTSAGAILTAEVASKLKQLGLPQPAALGIFSGLGDFARVGDSMAMYGLRGLAGHLDPPEPGTHDPYYTGSTDPKDPVLSPIYSDLHGLPPTLFVTSGRDLLLSGTANLHRAYLQAGVDARLVVFDALPHAFWYNSSLPEAIEANKLMADFFMKALTAKKQAPATTEPAK
jgi:epsilon-lactone hydrolase